MAVAFAILGITYCIVPIVRLLIYVFSKDDEGIYEISDIVDLLRL